MKKNYLAITAVFLTLAVPCWAGGSKENNSVSGLVGLDAALDGAVQDIEGKLQSGTPIVVTAITAPHPDAREFIGVELSGRFKNLKTLAREAALKEVEKEQDFQLSGLVSDDSAVGIGHFTGAQAVISGDMKQFADFTQLRLRIVDVRTSEAFIYSARINNKDRLLTNILPTAVAAATGSRPTKVSSKELDYLNRGNDFLAEGKYDEAKQQFDQAIAIDSKLAEAFFLRAKTFEYTDNKHIIEDLTSAIRLNKNYGEAYRSRGYWYGALGNDELWEERESEAAKYYDLAVTDLTSAIRINSYDDVAYAWRGDVYKDRAYHKSERGTKLDSSIIADFDRAIADYTNAIRINPNHSVYYSTRGYIYNLKKDYDRAIADYTSAIRIDPNNAQPYISRGNIYRGKKDFDRAIADFTSAIEIDPKFTIERYGDKINLQSDAYSYRGETYKEKGDLDRAIADYNNAIRLTPNSAIAYNDRGKAYEEKGDIDRAIADYENAVRLGWDWLKDTIERLRKQRGR